MIAIQEPAEGILQVNNRGTWNTDAWQDCQNQLAEHIQAHQAPLYLLFNFVSTVELDPAAFAALLTAPLLTPPRVGLAILVARRAHIQLARQTLDAQPDTSPDRAVLRIMTSLEDAFSVLLDRQVQDRINGMQTYGDSL